MPSYDDFVRDYWAPDRDQVLADMQAQQQQAAPPAAAQPSYADFQRDYWAPDRDQVLASMAPQQPAAAQPSYDDFVRDYWAPDRNQVLASMRPQTDLGPNTAPGGYGGYNPNRGQTGQGVSGNPNAFRDAWLGSGGRTTADLKAFVQAHPEFGATLGGSKGDKVYGPGGQFWADAVIAAGEGGKGASWNTDTGGGGGGGAVSGVSFGQAPNSTPFHYDPFQAPDPFSFRSFEAPTGLTEENDPGYQARLALGQQGVERSAAARGTLLTGGTLKDINDYAQNQASQEFGNVYNRALQTYGTQYQQAAGDYNTNFQNALNTYKTNFDTAFKPWDANYNQAYQSWLGNFNAAQTGFQNELASQGQRYSQLLGSAQLGLMGTNQYGGYLSGSANTLGDIYRGYGTQAGDNITNQGNAAGASQIAQGNAYGNMANQMGNLGLYASLYGNSSDPWGPGGRKFSGPINQ